MVHLTIYPSPYVTTNIVEQYKGREGLGSFPKDAIIIFDYFWICLERKV